MLIKFRPEMEVELVDNAVCSLYGVHKGTHAIYVERDVTTLLPVGIVHINPPDDRLKSRLLRPYVDANGKRWDTCAMVYHSKMRPINTGKYYDDAFCVGDIVLVNHPYAVRHNKTQLIRGTIRGICENRAAVELDAKNVYGVKCITEDDIVFVPSGNGMWCSVDDIYHLPRDPELDPLMDKEGKRITLFNKIKSWVLYQFDRLLGQ